jgi:hypothetical protein
MARRGGVWIIGTGSLPRSLLITTSAPAHTPANTPATSRAASVSEMWITVSALLTASAGNGLVIELVPKLLRQFFDLLQAMYQIFF